MEEAEVIIIGSGPSGLSAAITLASEGRSVILLEKLSRAGGQAGTSALIENYPPHPAGFAGQEFADAACRQCNKFGVQLVFNAEVVDILPTVVGFTVLTKRGTFVSNAVLIATGLDNRWLGVPGEEHPKVHHGMRLDALDPDCANGQHVVLIGGGNSAGQAAVYYLSIGAAVTLIVKRPIKETMSQYLVDRLSGSVSVIYGSVTRFRDRTGAVTVVVDYHLRLKADCAHIFVGQAPATSWLDGLVALDDEGSIITDNQHRTSRPGVFAVGDVVADSVRRVACAVGYGNEVVPSIHRYLDENDPA